MRDPKGQHFLPGWKAKVECYQDRENSWKLIVSNGGPVAAAFVPLGVHSYSAWEISELDLTALDPQGGGLVNPHSAVEFLLSLRLVEGTGPKSGRASGLIPLSISHSAVVPDEFGSLVGNPVDILVVELPLKGSPTA